MSISYSLVVLCFCLSVFVAGSNGFVFHGNAQVTSVGRHNTRKLQVILGVVAKDNGHTSSSSSSGAPPLLRQKKIGLLGGCSNVATAEYYKFLNDAVNERLGGWEIAETLIAGMNFGNVEAFVRHNDWEGLSLYMQGKVDNLIAGGADVILCSSNTLHKTLEGVMANSPIPMIHIADPTGEAIRAQGLKKVALFGTRPTMQMDYYKIRYWERFGVEAIAPTEEEQESIDRIIFDELCKGILRDESKARYLEIVDRMRREDGVEGVILGCTEIFLLLDQSDMPDFPVFNTAKLHCDAAVEFALMDSEIHSNRYKLRS